MTFMNWVVFNFLGTKMSNFKIFLTSHFPVFSSVPNGRVGRVSLKLRIRVKVFRISEI